jgi:hypothetical protein
MATIEQKDTSPIPESVLEALEAVRASGQTNMLARSTVITLVDSYYDPDTIDGMDEAIDWLMDNKNRYVEALTAMGERRVAGKS